MNNTLADFPIDIGAEWLHRSPDTLGKLINDETAQGTIDMIPYQLETLKTWKVGEIKDLSFGIPTYGEYKFKSTTWFQFFENHIIPSIQNKINYNSVVSMLRKFRLLSLKL
jgi:hypothetical protein